MGAAVSITRLDLTASELRKAASGEKDSAAARRILALALVLDGVDRKTAAETCGMDRQTLRDWVHRYNAAGLAGLRNLKSPGPGSKLTARQQAELAELVDAGPDPAVRTHREREKLVQERLRIENRIEALLFTQGIRKRPSLRSWERDLAVLRTGDGREIPRHLRAELDRLRRRLVMTLELIREVEAERDQAAKTKPQDQAYHKIAALSRIRGIGATAEPSCKDEARIGQQGTLTRIWAKRGTRPRAPHDQRYDWAYLFGAACPQRRVAAGLVMPAANAETMSLHLTAIGRKVAAGSHAALVLDSAGYHIAAALSIPENVTLVRLPPYAPELNPIENVWEYLRGNKLAKRCIEPIEALGYNYVPEYASWIPGELFFRKGPPGPWTHHVHLMEPSCPRWEALLVFRDYLRAHPEAARAYADVKRALAASSKDNIEAYRNGKDAFVEETTAKARAWRADTGE